jgi:hypothetical protein
VTVSFTCPTTGISGKTGGVAVQDCPADACLHLSQKVWLAPFDFGIMQEVDLKCCSAKNNSDYLEIQVRLNRKSGEAHAWWRINKVFLNRLRKQLLIWRSLNVENQKQYAEELSEH